MDSDWCLTAAKTANDHFKKICPKFDPQQWTVMAAIMDDKHDILAMATGIKCVPECRLVDGATNTRLPCYYDTVRDMHAEVLCRRALIRYILLNPGSLGRLYMYVTKVPCGDCALPPPDQPEPSSKKCRTGTAKGMEERWRRGVVRTKPGRGDAPPTRSVSCSDKLALWNAVGLQGHYMDGCVRLSAIIIDDPRADHAQCLTSLLDRVGVDPNTTKVHCIDTKLFPQGDESKRRCPLSIIWHKGMSKPESIVDGRKLGSRPPVEGVLPPKSVSSVATSCLERLAGRVESGEYERVKADIIRRYLSDWPRIDQHIGYRDEPSENRN